MTFSIPPLLPRANEADRRALGEFLCNGALYGTLTIPGLWLDGDTLDNVVPEEIERQCEKCGFETRWRRRKVIEGVTAEHAAAGFTCRNCGADFEVWFRWRHEYSKEVLRAVEAARGLERLGVPRGDVEPPQGQFHFQKVGQSPAPTVALPPDLAKALGKHQELYRRGMVSRNQNYGIGALGYFRRIVEETMDNMLDLLAEALREQGADPSVIRSVEAAKSERSFERKAEVAADALPEALRPGGFNPFRSMHALHSKGLHALTDEECVEIVDRIREDMAIIFKTLKTHVEDRRKYKEAAQRLQGKQSKQK